MSRDILVPLDGSQSAEHSIPIALAIASATGGLVRFAMVHVRSATVGGRFAPDAPSAEDAGMMLRERDRLQTAARRVEAVTSRKPEIALLRGRVAEAIVAHARETSCSLIAMTTHGRGALRAAILGNVAEAVVRLADVPVLLVRPKDRYAHFDETPRIRSILVPLDDSELSARACRFAGALARTTGASVTLLNVIFPVGATGSAMAPELGPTGDAEARARERLEQERGVAMRVLEGEACAEAFRETKVMREVIVAPDAGYAIADVARERGSDLIVMSTHGRGGLAKLVMGSVASQVVRSAGAPVMLVGPTVGQDDRGADRPTKVTPLLDRALEEIGLPEYR